LIFFSAPGDALFIATDGAIRMTIASILQHDEPVSSRVVSFEYISPDFVLPIQQVLDLRINTHKH
jgi:hypothetical protein